MSRLRYYASQTRTRRNLAALEGTGFRLLLTPDTYGAELGWEHEFAVDNGAWGAHQRGEAWDAGRFMHLVARVGMDVCCEWVALPDIVAGGMESLRLSRAWLGFVGQLTRRCLIPVQDGMRPEDVAEAFGDWIGPRLGIFVGGTTDWKLATMREWAAFARERNAWCHVARVNTRARIRQCADAGVDSFDGTSATRFADTAPLIESWTRHAAAQCRLDL